MKSSEDSEGVGWVIFKIRWPKKMILSIDLKVMKKTYEAFWEWSF